MDSIYSIDCSEHMMIDHLINAVNQKCWECVSEKGFAEKQGYFVSICECSCYECPLYQVRPYQEITTN